MVEGFFLACDCQKTGENPGFEKEVIPILQSGRRQKHTVPA